MKNRPFEITMGRGIFWDGLSKRKAEDVKTLEWKQKLLFSVLNYCKRYTNRVLYCALIIAQNE